MGQSVFYSSLWECVATNSTIRLPALTFVLSHLPRNNGRHGGMESQQYILGSDIQVICTAVCMSLTDSSVLVQRSALELLLQVEIFFLGIKGLDFLAIKAKTKSKYKFK